MTKPNHCPKCGCEMQEDDVIITCPKCGCEGSTGCCNQAGRGCLCIDCEENEAMEDYVED